MENTPSPVRTCLVWFGPWVEFGQDCFSSHLVILCLLWQPKLHEGRGSLVLRVHHCTKHRDWHTAGCRCYKNERINKGNDEEQGQAPKLKKQREQINEIGEDRCWTADQQVTSRLRCRDSRGAVGTRRSNTQRNSTGAKCCPSFCIRSVSFSWAQPVRLLLFFPFVHMRLWSSLSLSELLRIAML